MVDSPTPEGDPPRHCYTLLQLMTPEVRESVFAHWKKLEAEREQGHDHD